jgi:hypothetical protein
MQCIALTTTLSAAEDPFLQASQDKKARVAKQQKQERSNKKKILAASSRPSTKAGMYNMRHTTTLWPIDTHSANQQLSLPMSQAPSRSHLAMNDESVSVACWTVRSTRLVIQQHRLVDSIHCFPKSDRSSQSVKR